MIMFALEVEGRLQALGSRLRAARLRRNESQQVFAARIGISIPTYAKMEHGDPSVSMGQWAVVLDILGRAEELELLLAPPENLFAKYEQSKPLRRQRASRKEDR